jgi:hypothetical protein
VPFTSAVATSDVKNYDANGYVIYDPVITGRESEKDFTYKFEMQKHLSLGYALSQKNELIFEHHDYKNTDYQELQFVHSYQGSKVTGHLIPAFGVMGISYESPLFVIRVLADDFDIKKMKYLELYSRLQWSF